MSDTDNDDRSTVCDSKPHLDPRAVCRIANAIPNCSLVTFPSDNSYFSQFSRHLQQTFSNSTEEKDDSRMNEVLSFLVSDSFSVEQLAAEADGCWRPSMLEGAGIARVDVYCQTGTVCTCRVVQTVSSSDDHKTAPSSVLTHLADSTTEAFSSPKSINLGTLQVRRVIRRKCSLDALRHILERPPKLVEINESIIDSPREDDDDDSQAPSVTKLLRRRREKRQMGMGISLFSKEQQKFVEKQQKNYNNRVRHEEKVRQHVASAILAGGEEGVDLSAIKSLSLNDTESFSQASDTTDANEGGSDSCNPRQKIIHKIEIADMGLAILMAEAQRLERILLTMKEEEELKKKKEECDYDNMGSTSKLSSLIRSNDDTDESSSTDSRSRSLSIDSYSRQMKQGCEVEYSFPHEYHDELERALMGENDDHGNDSSTQEDSVEEPRESFASKMAGQRRGRSPARDTKKVAAKEALSPIVAIPTNGKGCVLIRQNGAFDVVGEIPEKLYEKLFKEKALPVQISLGTL